MIYIIPNQLNQIVLTLDESSRLTNPSYLFEFENEFNLEKTYWTTPDISNSCRYNLFELNENSSGSTSGGTGSTLSLYVGQYTYTVYESTVPTLSISGTTGRVVETGKMVVATQPYFNNNSNSIYI